MIKQYDGNFLIVGTRKVPMEEVHKYGIIEPEGELVNGVVKIQDMIEKPSSSNAPSNLAVAARIYYVG
jgi:UTP--glucose-1-phosphate uridylyltransferase